MCAHLVVAEDDPKQAELARRYLQHAGHQVDVVHDGRAALELVRRCPPELLVLDVMMPTVDGLDVCRILRGESDLPILLLTARTAENDLLLGLDLGADDYMTKPYSPRELAARVRTLLRRTRRDGPPAAAPARDPVLRIGGLTVDPAQHEVLVDGQRVDCTPGEFRLLHTLAKEPGRVFSREQLLERLHGVNRYITTRTVDVHVKNIRKKIEAQPRRPARLITIYGVGYKLAPARPATEPPRPAQPDQPPIPPEPPNDPGTGPRHA